MEVDSKKKFLKIGFTRPEPCSNEMERIQDLLLSGEFDYIHFRHPDLTRQETANLLSSYPPDIINRLTLHDYFDLTEHYNVGGIHLNSRNPEIHASIISREGKLRVSKSCHSIEELPQTDDFTYVTLSPIFDSVSKPGYRSAFPPSIYPLLTDVLTSHSLHVIALGGVKQDKISLIRELGFSGYAMLGSLWE